MENTYYVTHPRIDKTAVVFAPSTEKARTTFLDWLERNNLIRRAQRHLFRRDMIAEGIEDPNVPADVILHYGYKDFSGMGYTMGEVFRSQPVARGEPAEVQEYDEAMGVGEPKGIPVPGRIIPTTEERLEIDRFLQEGDERFEAPLGEEKPGPKRMPIQEVMLRGYAK